MSYAFLDKGVLLGFCFTVDAHHIPCSDYLSNRDKEFYITEEIEAVFARRKHDLCNNHEQEILRHVAYLERSSYDGQLGPMELNEIRSSHLPPEASDFLDYYYREEIPNIISMYNLKKRLRNLARDIPELAIRRKAEFDEIVRLWEREGEHEEIQDALAEIREDKEEDFWVCIDAHDLAVNMDGDTELATTDLDDLIRGGREELILENTALDDVHPVL